MTTCPKCGAQFADGTKFCEACGAQLQAAEATVNTTVNVQPQQKITDKIPMKFIKLGAIAVVAVIAVIVLCSLIFSGGENNFALYLKDGQLQYTDVPKFNPQEITSDYVGSFTPVVSKDGSKIFYSDKDSGSLYYRYVNKPKKDAEKIASDVTKFEINEKANLVTYLKNGDLYQHNLKESTKIKSEVYYFWTSENGKKILFVDDENNLYIKNGKKDAEKIKGEISHVYYVSGDLSTVYYAADGNLFCKKGNKDGEKIASDISSVIKIYETGEVLYRKEIENKSEEGYSNPSTYSLNLFDGKEKIELTDNYSSYTYASDVPVIVYSESEAEEKDGKYEIKREYFLVVDGERSDITLDDVSDVRLSKDGKQALILADTDDKGSGTLYTAKISGKKMKSPEKYDEDVMGAYFLGDDNDIITRKDVNDKNAYSLYFNNKKVDDDVYHVLYNEAKGSVVYFTDVNEENIGTLKIFSGKKSTKISDDVYTRSLLMTNEGDVLFLKDYNTEKIRGDLYIVKGKDAKKLDEDVYSLRTASTDYDYMREMRYDCMNTLELPTLDSKLEIVQ